MNKVTDEEHDSIVTLAENLVPEAAVDHLVEVVVNEVQRVRNPTQKGGGHKPECSPWCEGDHPPT